VPIPEPAAGEVLVRNRYFSLEPAIRGWLEGKANYFPPIPIGAVIRGPILRADTILLQKIQPEPGAPVSHYLGALGSSGLPIL
jgi:hypothetical protein